MVFGRAGGPANITVSDQSVSKRHARIWCKDGQWLLEDLKSVNGTVVNNRRITEPIALTPGFVFALSKHQFEIVAVDGASGSRQSQSVKSNGESFPSEPKNNKSKVQSAMAPPQPKASRPQPQPQPDIEPMLPPEQSRSRSFQPPDPEPDLSQSAQSQGQSEGDAYLDEMQNAAAGGGAGAVIGALPKAIAYYLAAVPMMALNPLGTIRRGVDNPKVKAMGALELIAFYLPVMLFSGVINAWAGGLATLIGGGGFVFMAFLPIGGIIGAIIGAIIGGLIAHPLIKFFVERVFKGETDDKTRTNAAIMATTALALLAVPQALTTLLTGVALRLAASFSAAALLLVVPALLSAVTAPLMPYIGWLWIKAWRCAQWAQTLFLVLVFLAMAGGLGGAVMGIIGAIRLMHGGGTAVVVVDDKKLEEEAKKAADDAKKALEDGKKVDDDGKKAVDDGKKVVDDGKKVVDDGKKAAPVDDGKKAVAAVVDDGGKKVEESGPAPGDAPSKGFPDYKRKRDIVEKMITDDPTLLKRRKNGDVGSLYTDLSKCTYYGVSDAEESVLGRKKRYDPALALRLNQEKNLKIYERCKDTV
ncbi:MAG TPA: FHA domain-containing protein, partial [Myxococcota bacterium]